MIRRFRLFINCFFVRRGHYFCPWYKPSRGELCVVKRKCRDCGIIESKNVPYDVWNSIPRENIVL